MQLAIVDLEAHREPEFSRLTIDSVAHAMGMEAVVFGIHDDMDPILDAERIFVTGSPDMVNEVDWAPLIAQNVAAAAQDGIPVLAVCFGHQMMAKHYGGEVRSFDAIRKGIQPVMFHGGGPFPPGLNKLILTHRDYVASPGRMQPVAAGGFGGIAALRHPEWPLWTLQGHPEWTAEICRLEPDGWEGYSDDELDATGQGILELFARCQRVR